MVSPLSARLLGLQSVDGSLAAQLKQQIPLPPGAASSQSSSSSISDEGNCNNDDSTGVVDKHGGPFAPDQKPTSTFTFVSPAALVQVQPATAASHPQPSVSGTIATTTKKTSADTNASTSASPTGKVVPPPSSSINETSSIRRHIMKSYRPIKPRQPRTRPSGYTADQESNASSSIHSGAGLFVLGDAGMPTFGMDTSSVNPTKDRRASQIAEHSRKRKVEELNYSALTVKEDLELAGKSYEYATQLRSRALPAGSVDMSKVRLVTSGTYDEMQQSKAQQSARVVSRRSTSITSLGGEGDDTHRDTIDAARSSKNVYDALIADTRQHYNICPKKQRRSLTNNGTSGSSSGKPSTLTLNEGNSASQLASRLASVAASGHQRPQPERTIEMRSGHSTATPSTSSDTESDASLGALEIAPRLEEGLMSDVTDDYAALSPPPPTVDKSANIITTTIESALSYSQRARLVVSSKDPFSVVHANAAYFRLAGLKSLTIVGQSLFNILNEPKEGLDWRSLLNPSANPSDLQNIAISKNDAATDADRDEKDSSETKGASSLECKSKALDCRISISPVSDSSSSEGLAGLVSGRVKITHYLLELTEFDENAALGDSSKNAAGDATDEGFSVIG